MFQCERTSSAKVGLFSRILKTRGPDAYRKFIYCLIEADNGSQKFIAEELWRLESEIQWVTENIEPNLTWFEQLISYHSNL